MIRRLIENKALNYTNLSNAEIGNGYPTGVYNVTVSQEGKTKTLQGIKR